MAEGHAPAVLTAFTEYKEVLKIIETIGDEKSTQVSIEVQQERFREILNEYQEQPHLLDIHLDDLVTSVLNVACHSNKDRRDLVLKLLYVIIKTRGFKVVLRSFPHEVKDVNPVLDLLEAQDPKDTQNWETHYCLLLWLCMVSMIPFDMSRLDGGTGPTTMQRILDLGKTYCLLFGKYSDAASFMLARFLTRPDVRDAKMNETVDWALATVKETSLTQVWSNAGAAAVLGAMRMLFLLFKHGKREDLLDVVQAVLGVAMESKLFESTNTWVRKVYIKLVQRIGLTFVKSRPASWRYQRGSRSLLGNLQGGGAGTGDGQPGADEEEEYDIPDIIEDVIDILLQGLRDSDTIVRWSAAKGVGRITGRLPKELADEVLHSLLDLFTPQEGDGAWHGGCLCLAELGRRGLLLPSRLPDVIPVVKKALVYDEKRGNFSVGAHVRDAASYVCWAFARAYDPQELLPYVKEIANALVIVSVFDREVNVRKAASAAFQENVGRQGTFPHGIDILTMCDYFAVGNLNNCYLELCVGVAQYEEYREQLMEHLLNHKVSHWHSTIRELTAQAFYKLVPLYQSYGLHTVFPSVIKSATSADLFTRHGSMLCIGQISLTLVKCLEKEGDLSSLWTSEIIQGIKDILPKLKASSLLVGYSGDQTKMAFCHMMRDLSLARCPLHSDMLLIRSWQELVGMCLESIQEEVQQTAAASSHPFYEEYFTGSPGSDGYSLQDEVIKKYLSELTSTKDVHRRGYAMELGCIPKAFVKGRFPDILQALIKTSKVRPGEESKVEIRRAAIEAITKLCRTAGITTVAEDGVCGDNLTEIYMAFLQGMTDYSLDSRGDVGAWVRESSMTGLQDLTLQVMDNHSNLLNADVIRKVFVQIAQQCCEKIDRTRNLAGQILSKMLHYEPQIPHIPEREELLKVFAPPVVQWLNWAAPKATFPLFVQLLRFPVYQYNVMLGFTVSVGGMTESLVKESHLALVTHLRTIVDDPALLQTFCQLILAIFEKNKKTDRVVMPLFKMLDQLLMEGYFSSTTEFELSEGEDSFAMKLFKLMRDEMLRCANPQKLMNSVDVFCQLLQFPGEVKKKTLSQMARYLCHRYPRIRKLTADRLYEAVLMDSDAYDPDTLQELLTALSETVWDVDKVATVKPVRDAICRHLGIPCPVPLKK